MFALRIVVLVCCLSAALALPSGSSRIVGGSLGNIYRWPYITALLYSQTTNNFQQQCVGTILSNRLILSAAQCFYGDPATTWRSRVGSALAGTDGTLHNIREMILHPNYNVWSKEFDIAVIRTTTSITYGPSVLPGTIAGPGFSLADNQLVTSLGWGQTSFQGTSPDQFREVQIWTVNQDVCKNRYVALGGVITDNMICASWIDVGTRGPCKGDEGGPLFYNNVVVGVYSFSHNCASPEYPAVMTRVSNFSDWIRLVGGLP